jgi:predicted acyl esterase
MPRRPVLLALLVSLLGAGSAGAASAPDRGTAWEPTPVSQPLYGTKNPTSDQQHVLTARDGVKLFVETWLPAAKNGAVPPTRVPTILIMTPYVTEGVQRYPSRNLENVITYFTARGFAVAQGHVRGTGESGGCLEQTSANQIDDGARIVEYLGRDAPWANGSVGMYGISYDGETQISVAGLGDPEKTRYLKAIIPAETVAGQYEWSNYDGVQFAGNALIGNGGYFASSITGTGDRVAPQQYPEKATCQPELMAMSLDPTGGMNPFWAAREYRPGARNIRAATLMLHGFADFNVLPIAVAGFFDQLPATTPKAGLFGVFEHNYPDKHAGVQPEWARRDWLAMATAWYDRHLKGLDSGADAWPVVQVQDSQGQWRAEPDFPATGGPAGQLSLGPAGALGAAAPTGATEFVAGSSRAVFTTPALEAPLRLTGQPVVDLFLRSTSPNAQVTAVLEVLGADGQPQRYTGTNSFVVRTAGARSLLFRNPMSKGWFEQALPAAAAPESVLRVPVRLLPTDLVVPAGGRLRLTLAGDGAAPKSVVPTGAGSRVTLLHDCAHPSTLRFLVPSADRELLNVRETDQAGALTSVSEPVGAGDGAGLASAPVCGKAPFDPQIVVRTGAGPAG